MSGDVQPRKRKDKKKKKDELGVEEPRGTSAVFGEGDVFIHSQQEHGTGGHWCAKIIFFSLLAVLVTLIGLIILENRGLTELEANSVESRYSGVLEGWIEDLPDDDHHDEHTLELKHHDEDDQHNDGEDLQTHDHDDDNDLSEDDHDDEDEEETEEHDGESEEEIEDKGDREEQEPNVSEETENDNEEDEDDDGKYLSEEINAYYREEGFASEELNNDRHDTSFIENKSNEDDEEEIESSIEKNEDSNKDDKSDQYDDEDDDDGDEIFEMENARRAYNYYNSKPPQVEEDNASDERLKREIDEDDDEDLDNLSVENNYGVNENDFSAEVRKIEEGDDHEEDSEEQGDLEDVEIEHIEKEITDEDILSVEQEESPLSREQDVSQAEESKEDDQDFLDPVNDDDDDELPNEPIIAPAGKPYVEIEEDVPEKPVDTLAEEEEYEKQQEELRREEAEASHIWLKLVVGGALLVATHAVLRRATAPRDEPEEENTSEESNLQAERRVTLINEESTPQDSSSAPQNIPKEEIVPKVAKAVESAYSKSDDKESMKEPAHDKEATLTDDEEKELYSDQEDLEEEEEEIEVKPKPSTAQPVKNIPKEVEPDEDDVEIIDEEQLDEEVEEDVEEEEEISDVDDVELLNRLEAKYGRLPEPERPGKHKDGGNSIDDEWPGEPSDAHWRHELHLAEDELRQGAWFACERRASAEPLANSARARYLVAKALDMAAEEKRDNRLLSRAISAYLHLLKMNENLPDKKLMEIASRTINRMQFLGRYLNTEPVYRLLIRRFPNEVVYRNNLTISFLMANRADLADGMLKETLQLWPDDRVALAHYGFVLKNHYNKLEEAVTYLKKALDGDAGAANEPRFYYHLGDALLLLGRFDEAHEVHKRGAALGHFLSPVQRSLYNVPRLKSRPWWRIEDTVYVKLARALEKSWREILKEGEAAKELYEKENEGLKEKGEWSQLDIFVQGRELPGRCKRAPVTCAIVKAEPAAAGCRRGQVKFSSMAAGTHVRPHVGPTNCRLRMHLGLSNTKDTYIRVDKEIRQWQVGKALMFDDSFEHEVWHNGTGARLVLIVDVWHPELSASERRLLPAI